MAKQVGKYAVMDITASVALGWTSNYASEKMRDMGLSSEEIFMVHLVASLSVMDTVSIKQIRLILMQVIRKLLLVSQRLYAM